MDMTNNTKTYKERMNTWLQICVSNSSQCASCQFKQEDSICFFAYGCIAHDFNLYKEDTKSDKS